MKLHPPNRMASAPFPTARTDAAGALWLRWVTSFCALVLYVAAATPLAPALTALVASLDSSHQLALRCDSHGARVVLHHECANSPTHVHGAVARVLTLFAQRSISGDPDHSIQFNNSDNTTRMQTLRVAPSSNGELLAAPAEPLPRQSQLPCFSRHLVEPRPPPGTSGLLLSVRSTVLLI